MREVEGWVCLDWGGTLMSEEGPLDVPMALWPEVHAIEGAREALAQLASRYGVAVATNASVSDRRLVERALARVDLLDFVDEVFCFAEIGWRKDSRRFWDVVTHVTGVPAGRIVMVGDTLEQDVLGPRESGIASIWFNEGGRRPAPPRAVATVTRLADVVPLVDAILRAT